MQAHSSQAGDKGTTTGELDDQADEPQADGVRAGRPRVGKPRADGVWAGGPQEELSLGN